MRKLLANLCRAALILITLGVILLSIMLFVQGETATLIAGMILLVVWLVILICAANWTARFENEKKPSGGRAKQTEHKEVAPKPARAKRAVTEAAPTGLMRPKPSSQQDVRPMATNTPIAAANPVDKVSKHIPSIPFVHGLGKSPAKHTMQWRGIGEHIDLQIPLGNKQGAGLSRVLNDPLTYFCDDEPTPSEASCINLKLPVSDPVQSALPYWPRYEGLTPAQRGFYLEWLASGRTTTVEEIGYVFIYFYGLERRVLIDNCDHAVVLAEVRRLVEQYPTSSSFHGYANRFITYVLSRLGIERMTENDFRMFFDHPLAAHTQEELGVALAWFYLKNQLLPASWAMRVARLDPRSTKSVVFERAPQEFAALFTKKYQDSLGEGNPLKISKRQLRMHYSPASSTLPLKQMLESVSLPNVLGIQSQFTPLVKIWEECIDELRSYSRKLASGESADSRELYAALPDALKEDRPHPEEASWRQLVETHMREDGVVLIPVGELAHAHGFPERDKFTLKQSQELASTAHDIGYIIEPDARFARSAYESAEFVCLYRPEVEPELPKGPLYAGAALILEIGLAIANADGSIDEDEVAHIAQYLEGQFMLEASELRRLEALKQVLLSQAPSLNRLGRRLADHLDVSQRKQVAEFLFGVAAINKGIDKSEIKALKRFYRAMGLDPLLLDDLLGRLRSVETEPVEALPGKPGLAGEAIPPAARETIQLDQQRIHEILSQTREVAQMLCNALYVEETTPKAVPVSDRQQVTPQEPVIASLSPAPVSSVSDSSTPGIPNLTDLDPRYHGLIMDIIRKQSWSRADFEALVRAQRLMPSSVVDIINEWSEEALGDFLLEGDDDLTVNLALVKGAQ